jgi:N-acetyl-anhydromuramoyl-L-alanine amidase
MHLDPVAGWLVGVRRAPSPNYDPRPPDTAIDLLVIHGISLPPRQYGGGYIDCLFTNTLDREAHPHFKAIGGLRVSAHALIDRQGGITQYVSFHQRAWHAGISSFRGRPACNDFSIGIELEGCDEDPYEERQYRVLAGLTQLLMSTWPGIREDRIVGHADISPGRKTDPGPAFDWNYFRSLLIK